MPNDNDVARCVIQDSKPEPRIMDRGYDADWIRALATERGAFGPISPNMIKEVGTQRREDATIENVKKLIMRPIGEYRNHRDTPER